MIDFNEDNIKNADDKETYHIFNYMEEHHSFFIASVSGCVAVGTLVIYILIFIFQCIKLQVCNIPIETIGQVKQGKFFYVAIIGTMFYCCIPLSYEYLKGKFDILYKLYITTKLQRKIIKKICKINKKKRNYDLKNKLSSLKKNVWKCEKEVIRLTSTLFFVVTIIFSILYLLFQVSMTKISLSSIIVILIVSVIIICIVCIHLKKEYKNSQLEELREEYENKEEIDKLIDLLKDICEVQTNREGIDHQSRNFKFYLSDQRIKIYLGIVLSSFASLCIVFLFYGIFFTKFNNDFWMFKDETGQYYAIVYQNEEQVILEEAYIDGDTIFINNNRQLFMKYEDNKFEYIEFEDVEYCDD